MPNDDLDFGETVKGFSAGQKMFNRYTLKKILGRGGMGVVWLGQDEELERQVALKFLPEVVAMDKQAVKDLKRETRRSLELTHPHIIRIYDFVQDPGAAAISMEFVSGATLASLKVDQANGHFEVSEIMAWVGQLCEALAYAHTRAEVVHRDLKPANLMIDGRGELKIADFGIAASVSDSVSRVSVQAGSSGTPVYMSPQQMMGETPAVSDDIYAVGSTLYELLTGRPPFYSGNVMMQVMNKVPPSMAVRRQELGLSGADIPENWEATIAACLSKEPGERPRSIAEVLSRLLGGTSRQDVDAESPPPMAASDPRPGEDLIMTIPFTTEQLRTGGTYKVPVQRAAGEVTLEVNFPAGMEIGSKLRLKGMGEPGEFGGGAGDLYLAVDQKTETDIKPEPAAGTDAVPEGEEKPEAEAKSTLMGNILFWGFWAAAAGLLANWFGLMDRIEKPTPETLLVVSGLEKNFSDTMDERSVNGFYRVKRALGSLILEGESEEIPVNVRDRSFYSWGDVIEVQTNRWTGKTTTGDQKITFRLAAEIPSDSYLVGETGTLALDLLMEVPVLEQNDQGAESFRNDEVRWQEEFPIKVVWKEKLPLSVRTNQVLLLLLGGILIYALIRAFCFGMADSRLARGALSFIFFAVVAGAGAKIYFDKAADFEEARERERRLAFAEEAMAQNDLVMAREIAEEVLDAVPSSSEARRILNLIDEMPVTLRVPQEYRTIQAAMDQAKRGDIVEIASGTYFESLAMKSDITIRGTGATPEDVVVNVTPNPEATDGRNVLDVDGSVIGRVENLTLSHAGKLEVDSRPPTVIVSNRGAQLTFTNVIIRDGVGHGLFVGNGAEVQLYDVTVTNCAWSGIVVEGSDGLGTPSRLITGSPTDFTRINHNLDHGVKVRNGAAATLGRSYFSNNATDGIRVESGATVEVDYVGLNENGRHGVAVDGSGSRAEVLNSVGALNGTSATAKLNGGVLIESGNDWQ